MSIIYLKVSSWALQREAKLSGHLQSLKDLDESLEELLRWLAGLESTLTTLEAEPLPDDLQILEGLISDHNDFMENTARRQPEVDRACKPKAQPKDHRKMTKTRTSTPMYVFENCIKIILHFHFIEKVLVL